MSRTYTTRDFRCVPCALIYNPELGKLSSFVRDVFWCSQIAKDDRHCLPFDAEVLTSILFPNRRQTVVADVAMARAKLIAIGAFVRKTSALKEWIEIGPAFRHEQGTHFSYGDHEPPMEQGQLTLLGSVTEPPRRPPGTGVGGRHRKPPVPAQRREKRVEETKQDESVTRALCARRDSSATSDYARDAEDHPECAVWVDLCLAMGSEEMTQNGQNWEGRWLIDRSMLGMIVRQWDEKTAADKAAGGGNAGAFVTSEWVRLRPERRRA